MPGRSYTAGAGYRYGYQGSEKDAELNKNTYSTLFRELDTRINRWWSRDPKSSASPWSSPYVVNGNNPIIMVDPLGDKEYESMKAFRKATGNKKLGSGDWLTKDRKSNSEVWKNANSYNLQQEKGFEEYTDIEQRASFYSWFQDASETKGFETKWAGAASQVAFAINELAKPSMMGINVKLVAKQLNYTSDAAIAFSNTGNKMIFEDVFPKLKTLYNGPAIVGQEAFSWDAMALSQEQNLIQPLYATTKDFGTISAASKQLFAFSPQLAWLKDINIKPFPTNGNLMDVSQRWAYGMQGMGHKVFPSQMPLPGATYTNGTMYLKFRGSIDKKYWNTPQQ